MPDYEHLRVLIANEKRERLELLAQVVVGLGQAVLRLASIPMLRSSGSALVLSTPSS